jgi:hypothetical protein
MVCDGFANLPDSFVVPYPPSQYPGSKGVLFPSQSVYSVFEPPAGTTYTPQQMNDFQNWKTSGRKLYAFGHISYKDIYGHAHETQIALYFRWMPTGFYSASIIDRFNHAT